MQQHNYHSSDLESNHNQENISLSALVTSSSVYNNPKLVLTPDFVDYPLSDFEITEPERVTALMYSTEISYFLDNGSNDFDDFFSVKVLLTIVFQNSENS